MSRKSFENNPIGFLKKFIARSHSLLSTAEKLGYPNIPLEANLKECSEKELLWLTIAYRDRLVDLQDWLVLLYQQEDTKKEVFDLIQQIGEIAECYRIKRF